MTRSDEGGLEEVLEFFCALAKRACKSATMARRESICDCSRLQLEHLDFFAMKQDYMQSKFRWLLA